MSANFGRIGILFGGASSEREISLKSGSAVSAALIKEGLLIEEIDLQTEEPGAVEQIIRESRIEIAFIAMHGRFGEDGGLQRILENMKIPFVGSDSFASKLAMNKAASRNIFKEYNIPVPRGLSLTKNYIYEGVPKNFIIDKIFAEGLSFPLVVKPQTQGSSIGVYFSDNVQQLTLAIDMAFNYDNHLIVEERVVGRELTVGILDGRALEPVEIRPKADFFDFNSKYQKGQTEYIIPADITEDTHRQIQYLSLKAHQVIGCRHFSRVDLILDGRNNPFILEINTIPGFTETSLVPMAASYEGISFLRLCLKLLEASQKDFQRRYIYEEK